jgi:hypothetical protein
METATFSFLDPLVLPEALGHEQDIETLIRRAIAGKQPIDRRVDRRKDVRYAFPYPIKLLPVDAALRAEYRGAISAIGKHLTLHGIDFYCTHPIAAKEVICQFEAATTAMSVVLELNWCRHNSQGWFENGGKFLRIWKAPARLSE